MGLPIVNSVWIGKRLGPVQVACLKSFLRTGHKVVLHTYGEVEDTPPGVIVADANQLWPEGRLLRYASNGSFAISGNLIRYQMMRQGLGLYVDCDMYCVRPMDDADYIMGWQDAGHLNNAVLKLPPDSPAVIDLAAIDNGWVPPWLSHQPPLPLNEYPWGTSGPVALTHFVRKHRLEPYTWPAEVFYPVHHMAWKDLFNPGKTIEDITTPLTRYVHLWNQVTKPAPLVAGSPLDHMMRAADAD